MTTLRAYSSHACPQTHTQQYTPTDTQGTCQRIGLSVCVTGPAGIIQSLICISPKMDIWQDKITKAGTATLELFINLTLSISVPTLHNVSVGYGTLVH